MARVNLRRAASIISHRFAAPASVLAADVVGQPELAPLLANFVRRNTDPGAPETAASPSQNSRPDLVSLAPNHSASSPVPPLSPATVSQGPPPSVIDPYHTTRNFFWFGQDGYLAGRFAVWMDAKFGVGRPRDLEYLVYGLKGPMDPM